MPYNIEAFREVHAEITADPEAFDMNSWESVPVVEKCTTTRCVAGWAVYHATGGKPIFTMEGWLSKESMNLSRQLGLDLGERSTNIQALAQELLGLNTWQGASLFLAPRQVAEMIVEAFANGNVERAEVLLTDEFRLNHAGRLPRPEDE